MCCNSRVLRKWLWVWVGSVTRWEIVVDVDVAGVRVRGICEVVACVLGTRDCALR